MKKNVVKVLAGIMVIGLLTACGKEESTSGVDVNTGVQSEADAVIDEAAEVPADQQEASVDEFQFEEQEGVMVLTAYNGTAASVTIPDSKDGKAVVAIGDYAFNQNTSIEEVIMPDSVTKIGEAAFQMCSNLKSVTFGNKVDIIEAAAFYVCPMLENVILPMGLTTLGENAFGSTGLKEVSIPTGLIKIENGVFSLTLIESVTIPGNIKIINDMAFQYCENLKQVEIENGVEVIGEEAFGKLNNLNSVTIPDSVRDIHEYAFMNSQSQLTIIAPAGSYAEQYAAEQEIAFQAQ